MGFLFCLKKELRDLVRNPKLAGFVLVAWLAAAVVSLIPPQEFGLDISPSWAVAVLSVALTCQFLCDSLKNDFRSGGLLFLLNGGCGFFSPFVAKCGLAVAAGILPCLLAFLVGEGAIPVTSLIKLLLEVPLAAVLAWLLLVATGGADVLSFVLSLVATIGASRGGVVALSLLILCCLPLCRHFWTSRRFRSSL